MQPQERNSSAESLMRVLDVLARSVSFFCMLPFHSQSPNNYYNPCQKGDSLISEQKFTNL
ncbi:hypothetical protein BpHYR1_040311 [Brachionus plicatilis]|uniref:Uncharacterized protein n=1 Tax=Brachionus plicatilis TaxID=10195 RepID=A0A3M7PKF0_BRAPC|nr:hypothetical protein BpHYR1_040311 [Brachionus plicatilis]